MAASNTKAINKKFQLFVILITAAMDLFHLGIVYPLFATVASTNGFIYSLFIGAFPLGQCIGAPFLGRWSDLYGRGRLLKLTVAGSAFGMAICALGISANNTIFILVGRLLGGLMGANMSIAYAAIADMSTQETKVKNLSLIPLAISAGFSLGPLFVGLFGSYALWMAVALSFCNWGLLWFFEDMAHQKPVESEKKSFLLLSNTRLWVPVIILFAMISANLLLVQFVGPYGVNRLQFNLQDVSWLYVNLSIAVAVGHLVLTRNITFPPHKTLPWSLLALAGALFTISQSTTPLILHITVAIAMLCCAVAYTNAFAHLSNHGNANEQGQIMGIGVSIQCLAEWLPAVAIGTFAMNYPGAPMMVGALACVVGYIMLWRKR